MLIPLLALVYLLVVYVLLTFLFQSKPEKLTADSSSKLS